MEPSKLDSLRPAFARLEKGLFDDIWRTQDEPDYGGPRWLELYHGSAIDETFVCVDFNCNVLHVRRLGRELLTITYIPGWFYEIVTHTLSSGPREDFSAAYVKDLDSAQPICFELLVKHEVAQGTVKLSLSDGEVTYSRLAFGYEFEPAHAFAVEETAPEAKGSAVWIPSKQPVPQAQQVHWSAMKLRVVIAPGVSFTQTPLVSKQTLDTARLAYVPHFEAFASCNQALQFELERRQDPHALPGLGARFRPTPLAETDLVAGSVTSRQDCALALEQTRPDGVDILLMRPGPGKSIAPWFAQIPEMIMREMVAWFIEAQGGIPPEAPLPIRIRVHPESPDDRFAYRIRYLDTSRNAYAEPTKDIDSESPCIRLAVVRTEGVEVFLDNALGSWCEKELDRIVEYREEVVKYFDDVPLFLDDGNEPVNRRPLPNPPSTIGDMVNVALTLAYYGGMLVPIPTVQMMYDLEDALSLFTYICYGRDVWGEEMTALDAAFTIGGFIVPEIGERAVKRLARTAKRLRTVGDDPFSRLVQSGEVLTSSDAEFILDLSMRTDVQ
jgi:hypothetical protein